jgi:hypothetical protein
VSSEADSPTERKPTPPEDLTPARLRVVSTIAYIHGPSTFERPDVLEDARAAAEELELVIDDVDRVLTSLQYTTLLNKLVEDGYLVKEHQGGKNPIILDLEYDEDRDEHEVAPFGYLSRFHTVVDQVLDREGLSRGDLDVEDDTDFNAVRDAVNRAVSRTVLVIVSDASQYRFTKEGYGIVRPKVE